MKSTKSLLSLGLSLSLALQLTACSHLNKHEEAKQVALKEGRCDDALTELSQKDPTVKLADTSKQVAGTLLSYSLTGASYTAEVLWDFAGGTAMFVGLCSPVWLLNAGSAPTAMYGDTSDRIAPGCFPGKIGALSSPPLGRKTYAATKSFRCPPVVPVSQSIRDVASCYMKKGDEPSLVKARQNLNALQSSKDVYDCLPSEEKQAIQKASDEINLKLISKESSPTTL